MLTYGRGKYGFEENLMKKVAGITLAISITLDMTTAVPVKADSEDHANSYKDNVEIVKAFTVTDGKITPISKWR